MQIAHAARVGIATIVPRRIGCITSKLTPIHSIAQEIMIGVAPSLHPSRCIYLIIGVNAKCAVSMFEFLVFLFIIIAMGVVMALIFAFVVFGYFAIYAGIKRVMR